jgi:FKBP-type peptidyl-prolyl cis-trans isomerase 2
MPIKNGDRIKIEYKGTLEDGTVFDSSERLGTPMEFTVGAGHVIKGIENAVVGMEKGEEKKVKLQPPEAFGEYKPQLVQKVSRDQFPKEIEPKPGLEVNVTEPNGNKIPGKVLEVTEEAVIIDMNHPLAGKVLDFNIKTVDIV